MDTSMGSSERMQRRRRRRDDCNLMMTSESKTHFFQSERTVRNSSMDVLIESSPDSWNSKTGCEICNCSKNQTYAAATAMITFLRPALTFFVGAVGNKNLVQQSRASISCVVLRNAVAAKENGRDEAQLGGEGGGGTLVRVPRIGEMNRDDLNMNETPRKQHW